MIDDGTVRVYSVASMTKASEVKLNRLSNTIAKQSISLHF